MRQSLLRRVVAALFVVVGIGVVSSALPAQAAPVHATSTVHADDWQWNS